MTPKIEVKQHGGFAWDSTPLLFAGKSLQATGEWAYAPLQEALQERFKTRFAALAPPDALPVTPSIFVGLIDDHPLLASLEADSEAVLPPGAIEEGYVLYIEPNCIRIAAPEPAGVYYGVRTLLERMEQTEAGQSLEGADIADWPKLDWRGMHILVRSRDEREQIERLITEQMPQLRLNRLILEINYNFHYQSHPELAGAHGLTTADCERLSELARQNNIQLIPMFNCLGHQSWAEKTFELLKAYPEFDETPDLPAHNPDIYCRSWCPCHPEVNNIIFALFDELIEAFHADMVHVGLDEVFILGQCPRCQDKSPAELFAKATKDYHEHLVGKRNVTMLMWGDRLLDSATTPYGTWEASANGTAPAIDLIPKDIIMCDWHYEKTAYPSVKFFQEKGFRVWPSGWNKEAHVEALIAESLAHRSPNLLGYLATTWMSVNDLVSGLSGAAPPEQELEIDERRAGLPIAVKTGARLAWTG